MMVCCMLHYQKALKAQSFNCAVDQSSLAILGICRAICVAIGEPRIDGIAMHSQAGGSKLGAQMDSVTLILCLQLQHAAQCAVKDCAVENLKLVDGLQT